MWVIVWDGSNDLKIPFIKSNNCTWWTLPKVTSILFHPNLCKCVRRTYFYLCGIICAGFFRMDLNMTCKNKRTQTLLLFLFYLHAFDRCFCPKWWCVQGMHFSYHVCVPQKSNSYLCAGNVMFNLSFRKFTELTCNRTESVNGKRSNVRCMFRVGLQTCWWNKAWACVHNTDYRRWINKHPVCRTEV